MLPPKTLYKMVEKKSQDLETSWNMAMMFYMSLIKLIDRKDIAAINNDLIGWYRGLKAIYRRIRFKLIKDKKKGHADIKFFSVEFKKAYNIIFAERTMNRSVAQQVEALVNTNAPDILDDIDMRLWEAMDRYSMVFPSIEIKGGLKALAESYGIK